MFCSLTITFSVNNVVGVKETVSIPYLGYTSIASEGIVDIDKVIAWSFECSNGIDIWVWALTQDNFEIFELTAIAVGFELSPGTFTEDSGRFTLPSTDQWVVVFINTDLLFNSATVEINVRFSILTAEGYEILMNVLTIGGPILGGIIVLLLIIWGLSKIETSQKKKKLKDDAEIKGVTLAEAEVESKQREFFTNGEFFALFVSGFIAIAMIIVGSLYSNITGTSYSTFGIILIVVGVLGLVGAIVFVVLRLIKKIKLRKEIDSGVVKIVRTEETITETEPVDVVVANKQIESTIDTTEDFDPKQIFCWNCGSKNAITQKFCGDCGKNLAMKDE